MENIEKHEISMTTGNFFKKIFFFSFPLMFSGILQLLYNAADLIVCGQFGSEHSVAAISATNSLINLIINLFLGLSTGANVLMARCFGSGDKAKGDKVVHSSMLFSLIFGITIGIFGYVFSNFFLILMETPEEVIDLSTGYLKIYFIGLPFSMVYNFGSSIMRATGDTKRPFYFLSFAGLFNVALNLLLVIVFKMDVNGVAIATIVSQAISAILVVISMINNKGFYKLSIKKIRFNKEEALEIIKIGLPAGIQGTIFSLSNVLIQSSINSLGAVVMDGNGAAVSLEGFVYTCLNSVAQACVAFVSANYAIENYENIKKVIKNSIFIILIVGVIISIIVLGMSQILLGFYVHSEEAIEYGFKRLITICPLYILCGLMDTFSYSLRGIGYSLLPAIVSLCGACGTRIIWIYTVFKQDSFHNLTGLALSYPISWFLTSTIHLIFLIFLLKQMKVKFEKDNNLIR